MLNNIKILFNNQIKIGSRNFTIMTIIDKFIVAVVIIIITSAIQIIKIKFPSLFLNFGEGPNEGIFKYDYEFKSKESDEVKAHINEQKCISKTTFLIELILWFIWLLMT